MINYLNQEQQASVKYISTPLLVLAGAGSGKTSVIIEKIAYLIEELLYSSESILAITFTNKIAKEMQERVKIRLDKVKARGIFISTFHSLGLFILKRHCLDLGYKRNFTLFNRYDSSKLIYDISYDDYELSKQSIGFIQSKISFWKSTLLTPDEVEPKDALELQACFVYKKYQKYLRLYNVFDLDDLIFQVIQLFRIHDNIQKLWSNKFKYILIDEYQDTNETQYQLLKYLTKNRNKFTVVGDDDQSIYAWRGSRSENLFYLQDDFPNLKVIKLEQNYRSFGGILNVANTLIDNNRHVFEKKLWTLNRYGEKIKIVSLIDDEDEAQFITSDIYFDRLKTNSKNSDYAILIRSNYQSYVLEKYMQINKIPYIISGGSSFFSKNEIKDIISYLKLIVNPDNDIAFLRIINTPKRDIGSVTIQKLGEYASKHHCSFFHSLYNLEDVEIREFIKIKLLNFKTLILSTHKKIGCSISVVELKEILHAFIGNIYYKEWLIESSSSEKQAAFKYSNILEFMKWISNELESYSNGLELLSAILNKMMLIDILDRDHNKDKNRVNILTMHASKGLEFKKVYIIGMEEGILPHHQSVENNFIEDERRLAYVAITRAKENLTITMTKHRKKFNKKQVSIPSRFINELPEKDLYWIGKEQDSIEKRKEKSQQSISALKNMFS